MGVYCGGFADRGGWVRTQISVLKPAVSHDTLQFLLLVKQIQSERFNV